MHAFDSVRQRRPASPPLGDLALAAVVCALALAEVVLAHPQRLWPGLLLAVLVTSPLAARRILPLTCTLTVAATLLVQALSGPRLSTFTFTLVGVLIALYSLGAYATPRRQVVGVAAALVAATVSALAGPGHGVSDALFAAGVVLLPWTVGVVSHRRQHATADLRARAERLEREQAEREAAAVAAERARIARELHDIVAHAVTVMVVQANAGERQVRSEPAAAEAAFAVIRNSGKEALTELRRMLELLRSDASDRDATAPQPSWQAIDLLVRDAQHTGTPVTLQADALDDVPESVVVALYRLVQEALTNAGRHAHGAPVTIRISRRGEGLELCVHSAAGAELRDAPGSGFGLVGMRERVSVFGGTLDARPEADGGFTLEVFLPLVGVG